jgi:hypothetical protein
MRESVRARMKAEGQTEAAIDTRLRDMATKQAKQFADWDARAN